MKVTVLTQDVRQTKFMQAAGVFEKSKVLVHRLPLRIDVKPDATLEKLRALIDNTVGVKVVAIFAHGQPGGWRDPDVKILSDGKSFGFLDDVLKDLGFCGAEVERE